MTISVAELFAKLQGNRKALLFIVYVALFLDNMLLTSVVPILPIYLMEQNHPNASKYLLHHALSQPSPSKPPAPPHKLLVGGESAGRGRRRRRRKRDMPSDWDDGWVGGFPSAGGGEVLAGPSDLYPLATPAPGPIGSTSPLYDKAGIHKIIAEQNVGVGFLFGSKALVQLLTNPWIGPLTNRIGYTVPMFCGFAIMFFSTLMFAVGGGYWPLLLARAVQGAGSACTSTAGMGMLAQAYPDDEERGSVMGIALGGLALGVLVGPPYGGILYEFSGSKFFPFLLLALLALFDGSLQCLVLRPHIDRGEPEGAGLKQLIKDPYIIVCVGAITIGNLGIAMLEPSLPLWMMETMQSRSSETGAAFLPASISYLIGTNIFGRLAHRIGRWLSCLIGLVMVGISLILIPQASNVGGLIAPNGFVGFGIGMVDASMFPQMGYLVDIRHVNVYGSIYAIADTAFCFAFFLGPIFSGLIVDTFGFPATMYIIAAVSLAYAPLMLILRNPPVLNRQSQSLIPSGDSTANAGYDAVSEGSADGRQPKYAPPPPPLPTAAYPDQPIDGLYKTDANFYYQY